MKDGLHQRAITLRRNGWSYNVIAGRLGVSKGTLSAWLRHVPYRPNRVVIQRIRAGPAKAALVKQRRRLQEIAQLRAQGLKDLGNFSRRDLWLLGLGLYMGEGSKIYEEVRFINSDPHIIRLAVQWFRKVCRIPERCFAIAVHLYPDTSQRAAIRYWSKVTGIPNRQFDKIQVDRRQDKSGKKERRLPYGTAHIKIRARGNRRFGVFLHRRIMGWLEAIYKTAGVV